MKKNYYIVDTTEFLHPFKIAIFMFKDEAKDFLKLMKEKYPANTYILKEIDVDCNKITFFEN